MVVVGPQFTADLEIESYPTMELSLAVQLAESTLMSSLVDDKEGVVTVIRALCQNDKPEDRLQCFKFFANDVWYAVKQPKTGNAKEWDDKLKYRVRKAFFNAYHRQICVAGIVEGDVETFAPETLVSDMDRLKKLLKFVGISDLTIVVALLFQKYSGDIINVVGDEDNEKVKNAMLLFYDVKPENLDTSKKARKYGINNNIAKRWCPTNGITATNDELPARHETILHKRVIRHSCQTFLRNQALKIIHIGIFYKAQSIYKSLFKIKNAFKK